MIQIGRLPVDVCGAGGVMWVGREAPPAEPRRLQVHPRAVTTNLRADVSQAQAPELPEPLLLAPNHVLDTTLIVRPG